MPSYYKGMIEPAPMNTSGGLRGLSSPSATFLAPTAHTITPTPGASNDTLKLLGMLASGGGALASLYGYGAAGLGGLNYTPSLTAESAKSMMASQGTKAYSTINRAADASQRNVASNFYARGLGSSGTAIGDIAGIGKSAMSAYGDVEAQLSQQLATLLQFIDQRDLQIAMSEQATKQNTFSTLGDLAMLAGSFLL